MIEFLIRLVVMLAVFAVWYWLGWSAGRAKERKRLMPWITLANPILSALRLSDKGEMTVVFTKDGDTWHAAQTETNPEDTK